VVVTAPPSKSAVSTDCDALASGAPRGDHVLGTSKATRSVTTADFLAIPSEQRFHELLGGEIIEKATPTGEHGAAQAGVASAIVPPYQRRGGSGGPGGWWIATEVEVLLSIEIVRPDVVG